MYVKIQRKRGLIAADISRVKIAAISHAGDVTLEFGFTLATDADQYARVVRLTAYTEILSRQALTEHVRPGQIDHDQLMSAIKSAMPSAKSRAKAQSDFAVASRSERIDGALIAARTPGHTVVFLDPSVIETQGIRVGRPVNSAQTNTMILPETSSEILIDSIVMYGVDPGSVGARVTADAASRRVLSGLTATKHDVLPLPIMKHIATLTPSLLSATAAMPTIVPKDTTLRASSSIQITVPATKLVRADGSSVDYLYLVFQALDGDEIDVDSITLEFNVASHTAVFRTPKISPSIAVSTGKSTATLVIRAGDSATERVRIVSRTFQSSGQALPGYNIVAEIPVSSKTHDAKLTVPLPTTSTVVYRAIPIGDGGKIGASFGSAVLRSSRSAVPVHAAITTIPNAGGLAVEVRCLPTRVKTVEILRKDMTLHERVYTVVGLPIHIADSEKSLDHVSIIDRNLKPEHVYEHACRITHRDGRVTTVGAVHTLYVPFSEGNITTEISDLAIDTSSGAPDVTFTIKSTVRDTHIDIVKRALVAQGVEKNYLTEITNERDKFQKLMVHFVTRVDLFEGYREDMGVVVGSSFRDSLHRDLGAQPIVQGHRYRYEVTAALRSPETLFTSLVKQDIDVTTKKSFKMQPAKWLHPHMLKRGTIVSPGTLATRHAQNEFAYGSVGNIASIDVVLDRPVAQLSNVLAAPFDANTIRVEWSVVGDVNTIDHFLIIQNSGGIRTIVGNCHSDFPHGTCEYFHVLSTIDHEPKTYSVVSVKYDMTMGDIQESNVIIV